jgi:hypothetical protein
LYHPKGAEGADSHLAPFLEGLLYGFHQGRESGGRRILRDVGSLGDVGYEFSLGHGNVPLKIDTIWSYGPVGVAWIYLSWKE